MLLQLKNTIKRQTYSLREQVIGFRDPNLREVSSLRTLKRRVPGRVDFQNTNLRYIDGPSTYYQIRELFFEKQYDVSLPARARILDCGSNIGLSLRRFRNTHPNATIFAFEADPNIAAVCDDNLSSFGDEKTKLFHGAAWIKNGKVSFHSSRDDAGHIGPEGSEVTCFDLADYFDETVDLMKLDIEGGEFELFRHLKRRGSLKNLNNLVCEVHQRYAEDENIGELIASLESTGLHCAITSSRSTPYLEADNLHCPFEAIENQARIFMLYAWRST